MLCNNWITKVWPKFSTRLIIEFHGTQIVRSAWCFGLRRINDFRYTHVGSTNYPYNLKYDE